MNPRGPLVAALLALGAAGLGCGPDRVRVVDSRGRLASVTLPESLVAGQLVPVYVDIGYLNCFETFRGFYVTRILGSEIWVEPMVRREITGAVCPAVIGPRAIFTYPARVPPAGPSIVHFVGLGDSIAVSLVPGPMPPGPEHRVVLLPKFGAVRVDSVAVSWFHGPATVASNVARTDARGVAVATLACPDTGGDWYVYAFDAVASQLVPLFQLPAEQAPCVRALKTLVPYGQASAPAAGAATSWRSSAATYSSGSRWWRNPARMALR